MPNAEKTGKVYLVGAGPGDPGLVTVQARQLIETADVIVYDYLANSKLLDWATEDAEKIFVGKSPGRHSKPQEEIEAILVEHAKLGKLVIRLKGGDPFIFGRGGEEIEQLLANDIPFEIVPGVTAALAAAAYTGIPLTHREHSSSITFLTGHENPDKQALSIDFRKHAKTEGTLCLYMGIGQLPRIVKELMDGGMSGDTPVAIVQWATLARQRSLFGTLENIVSRLERSNLGAPAIITIGQVVEQRPTSNWFQDRPLFGKRIVVTRSREQAGELTKLLESQGADVLEIPFIHIEPHFNPNTVTEVFAEIAVYEWILFTSANGVRVFFDLFYKAYDDLRCLGPMRIAAVGQATAREIRKHNLKVDLIPEKANADALADKLIQEEGVESIKMLIITGNRNRENLVQKLEEEGRAIVDTLPLYKTSRADLSQNQVAIRYRKEGAHAVLFTSSSTVQSFNEQQNDSLSLEEDALQPAYGSIGPLTSKSMKASKLPIAFEAPHANLEHFVVEIISFLNQQS
ncbi:MAG: uroporphyrinogen-III C-methyltransferase [Coraliomargaritaceae bacterium]